MTTFKNKVVAITGGSSGIGLACAKLFAAEGAKIAILGRDKEKLKDAQQQISTELLTVTGDVSNVADLENFFKQIKASFGNIDCLIANAGFGLHGHVSAISEQDFDLLIGTNYKGIFFTVQQSLPLMNAPSSIILVSSIDAHTSYKNRSLYGSTKAAVSHLAKSFAADLIDQDIRVNAISPGPIKTPIWNKYIKENPAIFERRAAINPLKRFGTPEEIAHAAMFLASEKSSYIVGVDLVIDGGEMAITDTSSLHSDK